MLNWLASNSANPSLGAYEVPLFTDAWITGQITEGYGPYQILNAFRSSRHLHVVSPAIMLRVEVYVVDNIELTAHDDTDDEFYHGGVLADELAALISLTLGVRLKAGDILRRFDPRGDPRGQPLSYGDRQDPAMIANGRGEILPSASGTHSLDAISPLAQLPTLSSQQAITIIRAARLYQDALWIAEADPALSWLLLVSAVETAASVWSEGEVTPVERLRTSRPELGQILLDAGGETLVERVADEIVPYMGATRKFLDFLMRFCPEPPAERLNEFGQLDWQPAAMKKVLKRVYDYRSRALHGGKPFPAPMCQPPLTIGDANVPTEVPLGMTMRTLGATWRREDVPLHLHTFEYIARGALLRWWESLTTVYERT